ncbi:MAG: mevalonate kinase [Polyangiales bacterium]
MAFGHGKVILLGEHSVVYGRPALAASLGKGVRARAERAEQDRLEVEPWAVSVTPAEASDEPLARAFGEVLAMYEERPKLHVRAAVELPGGAGLGCSAALGVAVLRALDETLVVDRDREALVEASMTWERVFHGNPSGVDNAMAAGAGMAIFRRGEPLEAVHVAEPVHLVIGHSGAPGSTKTTVAEVRRQHEREPERVERIFDGIASLVRNARLAVEAADWPGLGKLMDLNQALLSSLMVSTNELEEMCGAAREAGALGAKLTGGGGGGCMIALVDDDETAERVRDTLAEVGSDAFVVRAGA